MSLMTSIVHACGEPFPFMSFVKRSYAYIHGVIGLLNMDIIAATMSVRHIHRLEGSANPPSRAGPLSLLPETVLSMGVIHCGGGILRRNDLSGRRLPRHGRRDLLGHLSTQVPPVVVVALQDPDVPMAGESLDGPYVAAR